MTTMKIISIMILIGALPVRAGELNSLKQNILENIAIDVKGTVWNDLPLLPMELIVSSILHEHPLVPFILKSVKLDHSTFRRHTGSILLAVFNLSGDKVVTASWDGTGIIWDINIEPRVKALKEHSDLLGIPVGTKPRNKTGRRVKQRDKKTSEALPNTASSEVTRFPIILRGHAGPVSSAAFNRAGDKLVTGSYDKTAKIWDSTTGKCLASLEGHTWMVLSVVFNSTEDQVVTVSRDASVKTWDAGTGECVTTIILQGISDMPSVIGKVRRPVSKLDKRPYSAAFTRNGDKVLTISKAQFAKMWDTTTGICISSFGNTRGSFDSSAAFNASGDKVVTGSHDKKAKIWDIGGTCLTTLEGHTSTVSAVAFSRAGDKVVTGSEDNSVKIWDTQTGKCLATLVGHTNEVNSTAFNELGDRLVTCSKDSTTKIWDIGVLPKLEKYFSGCLEITLNQAVLLDSIYEVIKEILEKKAVPTQQKYFDFTTYKHLQNDYEALPQELQTILDPYVKKVAVVSNMPTTSTATSTNR